jgi:two-component sensor histidine kinase
LSAAREFLAGSTPDLMITDLQLPDGKGAELLDEGRGPREFPVVVMTSHGDEKIAVQAMKSGALDYIVKSAESLADMPRAAARTLREWRHIMERRRVEEQLKISLREKEILLREVYHRVKNNLQLVSSLLSLEAASAEGKSAVDVLGECQGRVRAMALVHERLCQAETLTHIDFGELVRTLGEVLQHSVESPSSGVSFRLDTDPLFLELDRAVPCGLIVNELLSNCFKHAFPDGRGGEVVVTIRASEDGRVIIVVADDGVGIPGDFDAKSSDSLGIRLINALTRQLQATMEINGQKGTRVELSLPSPDEHD